LRALARGNGLDPEKIVLTAAEEKIYDFQGILTLVPLFEARTERYGGPPRTKINEALPNAQALQAAVKKHEQAFKSGRDWIAEARADLRKQPAGGWGLNGARVELPNRSLILAASEACGTCRGRTSLTCSHCQGRTHEVCVRCQGRRQELCYNCNGTGQNLQVPGQPCPICHSLRFIPCRVCHGQGQRPCPICQGRGQMPCAACNGVGQTTEAVHITCGATTSFSFKGDGLPSSLRRGLDRIGITNLAKGHAQIAFVEDKKIDEPEDEEIIPGGLYGVPPPSTMQAKPKEDSGFGAPDPSKSQQPALHYTARMPFADLRVDFGGRKAAIGVFGLRSLFIDVPPFLDDYLAPALGKLGAGKSRASLNAALGARALREALELNLQGKGNMQEFRRLYPVGISNGVAENILRGTRNSIKRLTLVARSLAAVAGVLIAGGIFAASYFSSLPLRALYGPPWATAALDFGPPVGSGIFGLAGLIFAFYVDLHRHFPKAKISLRQPPGKTGYAMLATIVIVWLVILAVSPARPLWLPPLIH
jgi:hypothetical protein